MAAPRQTEKQKKIAAMRAAMNFCPMCGKKLIPFGGPSSEIKQCPDNDGYTTLTGVTRGDPRVKIMFDFFEE